MNLIYQQGIDSSATSQNLAEKYLGGMTAIQCTQSPRAWSGAERSVVVQPAGRRIQRGISLLGVDEVRV